MAFYFDCSHIGMKRNLHVAAFSSFFDVGICQYSNDNPLGGISTGSMDIDGLTKLVDFFTGKGHPILIIFNYGQHLKELMMM